MVTGCGRVLHQHRPLAIASVIHEVSVPSPGWGRRATWELDALSSCLSSWRGFTQQIVCLVLKATHSRTLILLGLAYWTGTGSGEFAFHFNALLLVPAILFLLIHLQSTAGHTNSVE